MGQVMVFLGWGGEVFWGGVKREAEQKTLLIFVQVFQIFLTDILY